MSLLIELLALTEKNGQKKHYIKSNGSNIAGPFDSEDEAEAALLKLQRRAKPEDELDDAEIVCEAAENVPSFDEIFNALQDLFDDDSMNDDSVLLKELHSKGNQIYLNIESRASEDEYFSTMTVDGTTAKISGPKVPLIVNIIGTAENAAQAILSAIIAQIQKDEQDRDDGDSDFDEED